MASNRRRTASSSASGQLVPTKPAGCECARAQAAGGGVKASGVGSRADSSGECKEQS